jgi:hypothetical protein
LLSGGAAISRRRETERRRSRWGLAPIRLAGRYISWYFGGWVAAWIFRARPPMRVWSGPKNGRNPHIGPPSRFQVDIGDLLEML